MLSGAIFRIDKTNARTPGILPDDPPQVLDGTQRAKGFELAATGSVTRDLKIFGAYTFIDGKLATVAYQPTRIFDYGQPHFLIGAEAAGVMARMKLSTQMINGGQPG